MTWWQRLWRRRKMEDQLEKELRFHLDQHASELIARGHDPQEAQRQARPHPRGVNPLNRPGCAGTLCGDEDLRRS